MGFFYGESMTVKELRDLLSGFPNDATVVISDRRNRKEYEPPWGDIDSIDYDCHNELLFLDAEI